MSHLLLGLVDLFPSEGLHLRVMEQLQEAGTDLMHSDLAVHDIPLSHELSDKYDILQIPVQCSLVTLPNIIVFSSSTDLDNVEKCSKFTEFQSLFMVALPM